MLTHFKRKMREEDSELLAALSTWRLLQTIATMRSVSGVLLDAGADVDIADEDGWTVLMYACGRGWSLDIVRLLLDAGANTNHQNNYGGSALHFASWNGQLEHVRLLLDFGADPNLADEDGSTPSNECHFAKSIRFHEAFN